MRLRGSTRSSVGDAQRTRPRPERSPTGQFWALDRRAAVAAADIYGAVTGGAGSELFAHGGLFVQGRVFAHGAVFVQASVGF
jgi:hypothetical protein